MVLYFAYGSNLDRIEMQEYCPTASFHGIAYVEDVELQVLKRKQVQ